MKRYNWHALQLISSICVDIDCFEVQFYLMNTQVRDKKDLVLFCKFFKASVSTMVSALRILGGAVVSSSSTALNEKIIISKKLAFSEYKNPTESFMWSVTFRENIVYYWMRPPQLHVYNSTTRWRKCYKDSWDFV